MPIRPMVPEICYYYLLPSSAALLLLCWLGLRGHALRGSPLIHHDLPSPAPKDPRTLPCTGTTEGACRPTMDEDDTTTLSDDDSAESILAAVSMLFGEPDNVFSTSQGVQVKNQLVARLLPQGQGDYEKLKPRERQSNCAALRELLAKHLEHQGRDIQNFWTCQPKGQNLCDDTDTDEALFCLLEVAVTLPSQVDPNVWHCISVHLHRQADEFATSSLRRVALSLQHKFQQQERVLRETRTIKGGIPSLIRNVWSLENLVTIVVSRTRESGVPNDCHPDSINDAPNENEIQFTPFTWSSSLSCASLWKELSTYEKCELRLQLPSITCPISIPIVAYPPTILSVQTFEDFDACVFEGIPLVVEVRTAHASHTIVTWFADQQVVCEDSCSYIPQTTDIGKVLSILVLPIHADCCGFGCEESYRFTHPVEQRPKLPLVSPLRDDWMASRVRNNTASVRILTYNLLGDLYTTRELDQQVMYNHCPPKFLNRKRRMPLLLYELLVYHADIICLQEVDHFVYDRLFRPCLSYHGYEGFYSNKASSQLEGCAMFWSLHCFQRADSEHMTTIPLRDSFRKLLHDAQGDESMDAIVQLLERNPELKRVTSEKVGQVLQVAQLKLLRRFEGQPEGVLVANTHLFYHPLAAHIRAMQTRMVVHEIEKRRQANPCPIVLCGDLNAHPMSGSVQLLLFRQLDRGHYETWKHLNGYHWEMGDHDFLLEVRAQGPITRFSSSRPHNVGELLKRLNSTDT